MAGVILCKDSRFRFVYHYRIIGLVYMKDKFFLMHMMPIVRAHIAIFDENGNVKEQLSESREEDLKLYSEIIKKARKDFPYIILIDTSVVVCVMWNEPEKERQGSNHRYDHIFFHPCDPYRSADLSVGISQF